MRADISNYIAGGNIAHQVLPYFRFVNFRQITVFGLDQDPVGSVDESLQTAATNGIHDRVVERPRCIPQPVGPCKTRAVTNGDAGFFDEVQAGFSSRMPLPKGPAEPFDSVIVGRAPPSLVRPQPLSLEALCFA